MLKSSLKARILLLANIAILTITVILVAMFYVAQKNQLLEQAYQTNNGVSAEISHNFAEWINVRRQIVNSLVPNVEKTDVSDYLMQAKKSGNFSLAFYGDETGRMIDADPTINRKGYDPRKRDWYIDTKNAGKATLSKPYISASLKKLIVAFSEPTSKGVVSGVVDIDNIINTITKLDLQAEGEAMLMLKDGTIIAYKDKDKILKNVSEISPSITPAFVQETIQAKSFSENVIGNQEKLFNAYPIADSDWVILFALDKSALFAPMYAQLMQQIGLVIFIAICFSFVLSYIINIFFRPLKTVSLALETIANGEGDLTQRIPLTTQDEIGVLANNFNRFVGSLHQLISQVRNLAHDIDKEANQGLNRSQNAVDSLANQQQELTMVATAVTEMSSATQEIAGNAEQTAASAIQSSEYGEAGKSLVNKTKDSINELATGVADATDIITELNAHAQSINSILSTIHGIAEQTNLLALNAAIEAARAGEQGRGFAVVADEVRVLSKRTATSTTEIQTTIETLQKTTQRAVSMMAKSQHMAELSVSDANQAAESLEQITRAISSISDRANQIATAAEEQSHVTHEISVNITAIKDVADNLADDSVASQTDANNLRQHASDLNQMVAHFRL